MFAALMTLVAAAAPVLVAVPAVDRHGDPLPPHALARLGTLRFRGATGLLQAAAVPGGKQVLGLGFASTIVLWDAATGKEVRRFVGPTRRPARKEDDVQYHDVHFGSFAVSPDGKTLVAATADGSGRPCPMLHFNIATGRKLAEWPGHPSDGHYGSPLLDFVTPTLLVSAGRDGTVRLWNVTRQRELRRLALGAGSHVSSITHSPDGKRIFVAAWDKEAFWMAWEAATGKLVHREVVPGASVTLAVSPDGATLALAMGAGRKPKEFDCTEMRLYSMTSWKERRRWRAHDGDDAGRCSIVFSPDGKMLLTGGADGNIRRWDARTGKEIRPVIEPCQPHSQNIAFLDASTLITFGNQEAVSFWDAATGKQKGASDGAEYGITAVAYSPEGRHVAGADGASIRVWDTASGKQVAHLRGSRARVSRVHFSPEGKWIVSIDFRDKVRLWDWLKGGPPIRSFAVDNMSLECTAFSPDGTSIATGHEGDTIRVWALSTGKLLHTLKRPATKLNDARVSALVFTADGQALLSYYLDQQIVCRWDLATGKEVWLVRPKSLGHSIGVSKLAISPGGRWGYSSSYDGSISVWEAGSGRLARVLKEKEPRCDGPLHIALSRDGTQLAAAFGSDWHNLAVHLWDLTTGQKLAALAGHRSPVNALAFSRDGRRLVSGSSDTTALVWDIARLAVGRKAPDGKVLAGLWQDLGAIDPKVAYAAVCQGAAAGDAAVARLKLDLKPAAAIDREKTAAWVRQLDADTFAQREKASQALADLGPAAETTLRGALAKASSPETRRRLERILGGMEAEHRRLGYALEVLEMIGTRAARRLLADLAKGASDARLTREARLALDRLQKRP
jgi:WD40 repeat protein